MNSHLETFISDAKAFAERKGLQWNLELRSDGTCAPGCGWNLTVAAGASPPPLHWLNDFGTDARTVEILNTVPPPGPVRTYTKQPLRVGWQDLVKACAIEQLLVRRNTCGHVVSNVARPLRVLATCSIDVEPWAITVDHVKFAVEAANKIQGSGKLADLIIGVIRSILDPNHLTDAGPLFPSLQRAKKAQGRSSKIAKSIDEIRDELSERKSAEKLPQRRAFWELVRIVFTEKPRSFLDLLRFAQVRTLILAGLRDGECALLPADWKRYREYLTSPDQATGSGGGFSRSLMLRHFAEKQRIVYEDSNMLFETVQHVPVMFEETLANTLDQVVTATEPLRLTLRKQIEEARPLPCFASGSLVLAAELYTYLSGNPFFVSVPDEIREKYIARYQMDYSPSPFHELREEQMRALQSRQPLDMAAYVYLNRFKGAPYRTFSGREWGSGRKNWSEVYLRIDEVEDFINRGLPTKRSDISPIKTAGGQLSAWELLFLMPKRALAEGREDGLCDVTRHCAIGRMDRQMITHALSKGGEPTLFARYGETEEDRTLTIRPHSLRHLQNTELFRLGVADTIITKRFNRRRVAQSYEYDHRSLAEELDRIDLKPEVESRLSNSSATVARLIKSGKATGAIVQTFRAIQKTHGEDAAVEFLRVEADGFHSTPFGHCINSFLVDPCEKHLECFNGCRHLTSAGLTENRNNLVQLEGHFEAAVKAIEARKQQITGRVLELPSDAQDQVDDLQLSAAAIQRRVTNFGLDNQLDHATTRLKNIRKLLTAAPGEVVFPDGKDLSKRGKEGTVLDDIL